MPIHAKDSDVIEVPEVVRPAVKFPYKWVSQITINWPHGTPGRAVAELHPLSEDRSCVKLRLHGEDTMQAIDIPNMLEAIDAVPELGVAMGAMIAAVQAYYDWQAKQMPEEPIGVGE